MEKTSLKFLACFLLTASAFIFAEAPDSTPLKEKTKSSDINPDTLTQDLIDPTPASGKKKTTNTKKENEPDPSKPLVFIGAVSIYGTDKLTDVDLKEFLGKELNKWIDMGFKGDSKAMDMQKKLARKVKDKWGFAFADWSMAQFMTSNGTAVHLTLDVVEKEDAKTRMAFLPEPKESFSDPDGLIEQWRKYESAAFTLLSQGQLIPDTEKCVAFHCPFGHKAQALQPYESIFVNGVKKNAAVLKNILKKDKSADHRSAAAFLLAYDKNGTDVVNAMVEQIPDSDVVVRNNALRVLGHIARNHRDLVIPLMPVLKALDYPRVSDRAKAIIVIAELAEHVENARELIRNTSGNTLLRMLASKEPDQADNAHKVLRRISGRDFPADDIKSWKRWVGGLMKDPIAKKP